MTEPKEREPAAWARTAYEPGGGDAFVFYAVYADASVAPTLDVSASRHRTRGLPDGVVLVMRPRSDEAFTSADFALFGTDAAHAAAASAELQFVIGGFVADPSDLLYLRDTIGVVAALIEAGATAVFDLQTLSVFTASEFIEEVFVIDEPDRETHIAFLKSADERPGHVWLHTRGLRKFGRPDLSIPAVPEALTETATLLMHRFAELMLRGGLIPEGKTIVMNGYPDGHACHHAGSFDDPDFNNVHMVIRESTNAI